MARTKQTARKWTGGKEPRVRLPSRKESEFYQKKSHDKPVPDPPKAAKKQVKAPTKQMKPLKKEPRRVAADDKVRMRIFAVWKPLGLEVVRFIRLLKKDSASESPAAFSRLVARCCATMRVMGPEAVAGIGTARDMHAAIASFRAKKTDERRAEAASRLPSCEVTETREETVAAAAQWEGGKSKKGGGC